MRKTNKVIQMPKEKYERWNTKDPKNIVEPKEEQIFAKPLPTQNFCLNCGIIFNRTEDDKGHCEHCRIYLQK